MGINIGAFYTRRMERRNSIKTKNRRESKNLSNTKAPHFPLVCFALCCQGTPSLRISPEGLRRTSGSKTRFLVTSFSPRNWEKLVSQHGCQHQNIDVAMFKPQGGRFCNFMDGINMHQLHLKCDTSESTTCETGLRSFHLTVKGLMMTDLGSHHVPPTVLDPEFS